MTAEPVGVWDERRVDVAREQPRLAWSDVWLLEAVAEKARVDWAVRVPDLLDAMDFEQHLVPWFEVFSHGAPRLVSAGYIEAWVDEAGELWLRPTRSGAAIVAGVRARPLEPLGESTERLEAAPGIDQHAGTDAHDPSLGPMPGYDERTFDRAIRRHQAVGMLWVAAVAAVALPLTIPAMAVGVVVGLVRLVVLTVRALVGGSR